MAAESASGASTALSDDAAPFEAEWPPFIPFGCGGDWQFVSVFEPLLCIEFRELDRTGVAVREDALRFCGTTENGDVLSIVIRADGKFSVEAITSNLASTLRSGWKSVYGLSSRGLMLDLGNPMGRPSASSRRKDPVRRRLPLGRPRGAIPQEPQARSWSARRKLFVSGNKYLERQSMEPQHMT